MLRVTHRAKIAIGGRKSWLTLVSISNLLWKTVATLKTLGAISLRSVLVQFVEAAKKPEALHCEPTRRMLEPGNEVGVSQSLRRRLAAIVPR